MLDRGTGFATEFCPTSEWGANSDTLSIDNLWYLSLASVELVSVAVGELQKEGDLAC